MRFVEHGFSLIDKLKMKEDDRLGDSPVVDRPILDQERLNLA